MTSYNGSPDAPEPEDLSKEWCHNCPQCYPADGVSDPCGKLHDCEYCEALRDAPDPEEEYFERLREFSDPEPEEDEFEADTFEAGDPGDHAQVLYIESLIPIIDGDSEEYLPETVVAIESWLINELDLACEALADGAPYELGELVRMTPASKGAPLPGLQMVHYERLVVWTSPAEEEFTIEDAQTIDEDGEDWDQLDPALYRDADPAVGEDRYRETFDADLGGLLQGDEAHEPGSRCPCGIVALPNLRASLLIGADPVTAAGAEAVIAERESERVALEASDLDFDGVKSCECRACNIREGLGLTREAFDADEGDLLPRDL